MVTLSQSHSVCVPHIGPSIMSHLHGNKCDYKHNYFIKLILYLLLNVLKSKVHTSAFYFDIMSQINRKLVNVHPVLDHFVLLGYCFIEMVKICIKHIACLLGKLLKKLFW